MARGVLVLGAVTSLGCVVPVQLQDVEQPANYPPVFVTDQCTPTLEAQITPGLNGTSMLQGPHIVVDDIDAATGDSNNKVPETLTARIFKLNTATGALVFLFEAPAPNANPLTPTRFVADFALRDWCGIVGSGDFDMVVIVADRLFCNAAMHESELATDPTCPTMMPSPSSADGGMTINKSSSGWRLHCQSQ